jgi:hypothetical protein
VTASKQLAYCVLSCSSEAPIQVYWFCEIPCEKSALGDLQHLPVDMVAVDSDNIVRAMSDEGREPESDQPIVATQTFDSRRTSSCMRWLWRPLLG